MRLILLLIVFLTASCSNPSPKEDDCGEMPGTIADCGNWVCELGEWTCEPVIEVCESDPRVGTTCGEGCGGGVFICNADDNVVCDGTTGAVNACGGCDTLSGEPGDLCETCGELECVGDRLVCVEPVEGCNTCEPDPGPCDTNCSVSFWECTNDEQTCNSDACFITALSDACVESDECQSVNCSMGFCAPVGFVYVPAGTFTMGAPLGEMGRHIQRENGQHDVTITRAMFVKETVVTQAEWQALFMINPSYFLNCGLDCPVERVNLFEMFLYANMLSIAEGFDTCYDLQNCRDEDLNEGCPISTNEGLRCQNNTYICDELLIQPGLDCNGYRLPTESEWEYVARAGTETAFLTASGNLLYWGLAPLDPEMDQIAWYYPNTSVDYETAFNCLNTETRLDCLDFPEDVFLGTHPVAQKLPNNWGLYDMTGNVWERVWDLQTTYPDPGTLVVDPVGPVIDQIGLARAMRGAPFNANGQYLRVAYRTGPPARSRSYNTGFRLVRSIIP